MARAGIFAELGDARFVPDISDGCGHVHGGSNFGTC